MEESSDRPPVEDEFCRLQLELAGVAESRISQWPGGPERTVVESFIHRVHSSYGDRQQGPIGL